MAKRGKRMHGRILAVWEEQLGTTLTADAAAGATTLYVDDISPFNDDEDEPGGWLQVGDQVIEYTTVDDDASTIKLATGLTSAVSASGDEPEVWVWNDLYDEVDTVQWAQVMPDGKRDQADAIEAVVSDSIDGLSNGDRGRPREGCLIERDGDEWELVKVKGRPSKSRGVRWEWDDVYVLTTADVAAGSATCPLSHRPMLKSVDAKLNGLGQESTEYSVNYDAQTVTWPLDGWEKAGDRLAFHYTYRKDITTARASTTITDTAAFVGTESMNWPAGCQVGDLVIVAVMQGPNDGFSALNGWTNLGASAQVTHNTNSGPLTYRLVVLAKVRQAGDVFPTRIDGLYQSVFMVVSMRGPSGVSGVAFGTVGDAAAAATPALSQARIRVWGTVSDDTNIVPQRGDVLANIGPLPNQDIDICVTADTTDAAVTATLTGAGTAGWCVATIAIGG